MKKRNTFPYSNVGTRKTTKFCHLHTKFWHPSLIADTLHRRLAQDLRRFEANIAPTIFRKFIDMPGRVVYDGNKFAIKIRKRAHTPILKEVDKLQKPFQVPWLSGKTVEIVWTA